MSKIFMITLIDSEENTQALSNFNRENTRCYQKKHAKTKYWKKSDTSTRMYSLCLMGTESAKRKIINYCKVKNISTPTCEEAF